MNGFLAFVIFALAWIAAFALIIAITPNKERHEQ
jgi:hypothetical protein